MPSQDRLAWIIVSICGALMLAIVVLLMILIDRGASEWSKSDPDDRPWVQKAVWGARVEQTRQRCVGPAQWITADDYPVDAIRRELQGTVRINWTVGDDGRVPSCRVLESSGHASLDSAACRAIVARGCYDPAKLGPERTFTRRVVWKLPE